MRGSEPVRRLITKTESGSVSPGLVSAALLSAVICVVAFARILESRSGDVVDVMLDTWPARLVVLAALTALVGGSWLAVRSVRYPVANARAGHDRPQRVDPGYAPLVIAAGIAGLLVLGTDSQSADSAVLISTSRFLDDGNWRWLLESQEAPLPHLVYPPLVRLGLSFDHLAVVPILGTFALLGWIGWTAAKQTGSPAIGSLAVLAATATPTMMRQANRLTFYSWFTLFGVAGVLTIVRWIRGRYSEDRFGLLRLTAGGLGIAAAVAAHGAGLYFAVVSAATLVLVSNREELRRWLMAMLVVALASAPWLISRYAVGGVRRFFTPRDSWILNQGYLLDLNERFWGHAVDSRASALFNQPDVFLDAVGWHAPLLVLLVFLGLTTLDRRQVLFIFMAALLLVGPLAITRSAGFPRYFYLVVPGIVLVAARGANVLLTRWLRLQKEHVLITGALLLYLTWVALLPLVEGVRADRERRIELGVASQMIGSGDVVVGYRSMILNTDDPSIRSRHQDLLTEDEMVAFYSGDFDLLERLMGPSAPRWALLVKPLEHWESAYNDAWFEEAYGGRTSYVDVLELGQCKVLNGRFVALYELDQCTAS